jgi:ADP-heptose:LPS heptosyltransferase
MDESARPSAQERIVDWAASARPTLSVGEAIFRLAGRRKRAEQARPLREMRGILVLRLDEIGDVVMTSPFLRELRRNAPRAWITLVVKPEIVNLVERCPYVNEVLAFDPRALGLYAPLELHRRTLVLAWKRLWRRHFDLALLPRSGADYCHAAFLAYFSGATRRVGFGRRGWDAEPPIRTDYDALLTDVLDCRREMHEVERNLQLLRTLGGRVESTALELWSGPEDEAVASDWLADSHRRLVAFGPGGAQERKRWPMARFIALGRWLAREYDVRMVVIGGKTDQSAGAALSDALGDRVIDLTGRTTLRQAAAVLRECALYVGNDTGPMHLAAAVGTPVVVISCHPRNAKPFFLNSPERFGPWGVPAFVLQPALRAPCAETCSADRPHCILSLTAEQVSDAVKVLLCKESESKVKNGKC